MATMTATRTPAADSRLTDGTLSNEALRTLSAADLRATYTYAVRGRKIAAEMGSAVAVTALDGYLRRIVAVGTEVARRAAEGHDTPCVCGTYDRCKGVRALDAQRSGRYLDQFRAYND